MTRLNVVLFLIIIAVLFIFSACTPSGNTSPVHTTYSTTIKPLTSAVTTSMSPTTGPTSEPCVRPVFTASPLKLEKISEIVTLDNVNPPGHTFPTDHIYFYITRPAGNPDRPDVANVYAPGDLLITEALANEHVGASFTDYSVIFQPCEEITVSFGHVSSLNPAVFGDTASFAGWNLNNEYSTGGETYRVWSKDFSIQTKAGDLLGTAGGNPGQWALDFGLWDKNYNPISVANPQRWEQYNYLHALCPLTLYEPGPLLDSLIALVNRDKVAGEDYPWGSVIQDVPGTAQGCWFLKGTINTYPEDPHLALVHSNIHPAKAVLSVGTSLTGLRSAIYEFIPVSTGLLNQDFRDITPDGNIYGFHVSGFNGIIIISMPDADTLYVEALEGTSETPGTWSFTENKTVFVR